MERGFQESEIASGDYVLGAATSLKGKVLMPGGQWDDFIPVPENQTRPGGPEVFACVSFAVLNAVETLMRQEFGEVQNLSDRWLAWATDTWQKKGNDPTTVCKFLGKRGDVPEKDWPYPTPASDFYITPPVNLWTLALEFPAEFDFDNQWVPGTPEAMKDALTRSPLTVAGYAWAQRNNLYYWPDGALPDHYFVVYGYVDGQYWKAIDTYSDSSGSNLKKIEWDYPFLQIKEHTLHKQVISQTWFDIFIKQLRAILGL